MWQDMTSQPSLPLAQASSVSGPPDVAPVAIGKLAPELLDVDFRSLDVLPAPIAAEVLAMLAVDAQQAVILATLTRDWHRYISADKHFQELFECHARTLVRTLAAKHLSFGLDRTVPYQVNNFMRSWLEVQFPAGLPFAAWRANAPPQLDACFDARSVYISVKQRLEVKEQVLHKALTLNRLMQWMSHDGAWIDKVNALTVVFLVPQGLFWLAVHVDNDVEWAGLVGRVCGLAACLGGAACTLCAAAGQSRIIFLKWDLRREIGTHPKTAGLALLKDRCEALNLYRCACWACAISVATWWLLLQAPIKYLLLLSAILSALLSALAVAMWHASIRRRAPFPVLFKFWFMHVWGLTPFFCALTVAHYTSGSWKLVAVVIGALGPAAVLCGDATMLLRGRLGNCCVIEEAFQLVIVVTMLLLVLLALSVACGRSMGMEWAEQVPLTPLVSPLQLPILACLIAGAFNCVFSGAGAACRAVRQIFMLFIKCRLKVVAARARQSGSRHRADASRDVIGVRQDNFPESGPV